MTHNIENNETYEILQKARLSYENNKSFIQSVRQDFITKIINIEKKQNIAQSVTTFNEANRDFNSFLNKVQNQISNTNDSFKLEGKKPVQFFIMELQNLNSYYTGGFCTYLLKF